MKAPERLDIPADLRNFCLSEVGLTVMSCRSEVMVSVNCAAVDVRTAVPIAMSIMQRNTLLGNRLRRAGRVATFAFAAQLWFLTLPTQANQNPNQSLVASGGTVSAQSPTHRVSGAIGQVASARATSSTHTVAGGFWNTVGLCDCPFVGDLDTNGVISISDVVSIVNIAFRGAAIPPSDPLCPLVTRADVTCDGVVSIQDVVTIVNTAFRGNDARCDPCQQ